MATPQLSTKRCGQCGAENDLILSNCKHCNSSLPRTDLDTLPEEQLLNNCSYWLAILEGLKDYSAYHAAKSAEDMAKQPLMGLVSKLTSSGPGLSEIIGNTDKYIRALAVRAKSSLELAAHIQEFKERQQAALATIEANRKKKRRMALIIVPAAIGGLLLMVGVILYFTVVVDMKKEAAEETRLNAVVEKAEQALAKGDKTSAKFFISQIKWGVTDIDGNMNTNKAKAWDEKRETMLKAIGE